MDPTQKKQPKSTKPYHHAQSDATVASSTIRSISKRFSRLYSTHHHRASNTQLQAKSMAVSAIHNAAGNAAAKSNWPLGRAAAVAMEKDRLRIAVRGEKPKKEIAKESSESHDADRPSASTLEVGLRESHEGYDLKRPSFSLSMAGGRRRSFCNSQTELADFFSCSGAKVVAVDMPPLMQVHAVDRARKTYDSLEKFTSKSLAYTLKKEFDKVYGPAWHCIVGTSFGSFVTHSVGGFLYFSMDHKLYILLFKTTVQRADCN